MTTLQRLLAELAAAALVGLVLFGWGHHSGYTAGLDQRDKVQAAWDAERARQTTAALRASEDNRATEQALNQRAQEAQHAADYATTALAAAVRRGDDEHRRLLDAARAATRGGGTTGDPGIASGGCEAPATRAVLPDVLGRIDEAAGELAHYADQLSIALDACVSAWPVTSR